MKQIYTHHVILHEVQTADYLQLRVVAFVSSFTAFMQFLCCFLHVFSQIYIVFSFKIVSFYIFYFEKCYLSQEKLAHQGILDGDFHWLPGLTENTAI